MAAFTWSQLASAQGSATSVTTTGVTTQATGSTFVACVGAFTNTIGASPVTDNKGNTYVAAIGSQGSTEGWGAIFYCENASGGAGHTFTFTPTGSDFISITVVEITGAAVSSALTSTNFSTATGLTHVTGNVTAGASAPEVLIACVVLSRVVDGVGTTAYPALVLNGMIASGSAEGMTVAGRLLNPSQTASVTFTMAASNPAFAGAATFKAAATSSGGSGGAWAYA